MLKGPLFENVDTGKKTEFLQSANTSEFLTIALFSQLLKLILPGIETKVVEGYFPFLRRFNHI